MRSFYGVSLLLVSGSCLTTLPAQESAVRAVVTPCILQDAKQHCSEASLRQAVSSAKAIAIESSSRDRVGESQLRSLVTKLGKSLALDMQSADLTMKVTSINQAGVNYGAMDRDLARLQVYAPVGPASRSQLVWEETLSGPTDLSWPAAVARLLDQFRHKVDAR